MITGKQPTTLRPLRKWREGIEVDQAVQRIRVRLGCFCDGETTDDNGKVIAYDMCPQGANYECSIFQDQERLGLDVLELACMGGKNPADDAEFLLLDLPEVEITDGDLCEIEVAAMDTGFGELDETEREVNEYGEWE